MTSRSEPEDGRTARERLVAAIRVATGADGYDELFGEVADLVLQSTSPGEKGDTRHARGRPWGAQPIVDIPSRLGPREGLGYLVGQAMKKQDEALALDPDRSARELHGAAVYLLAAAAHVRRTA